MVAASTRDWEYSPDDARHPNLPRRWREQTHMSVHHTNDPAHDTLENAMDDEELSPLDNPLVPDEVKEELLEDVERRHEAILDSMRPEGPP
jgi:predicted lipoprotein